MKDFKNKYHTTIRYLLKDVSISMSMYVCNILVYDSILYEINSKCLSKFYLYFLETDLNVYPNSNYNYHLFSLSVLGHHRSLDCRQRRWESWRRGNISAS